MSKLLKIKDRATAAEVERIQRQLERRLTTRQMDMGEVAENLGNAFKDGQIEALNRVLNGQTWARCIKIVQPVDDLFGLYVYKQAFTGAVNQAVYLVSDDGTVYTGFMENLGNGGVLHLKGRKGDYPCLYLESGAGAGRILDSSIGAYLSSTGVWTDAPCTTKHKQHLKSPDAKTIAQKIKSLKIGYYRRRKAPKSKRLIGDMHVGPDAEQMQETFGIGNGDGISPSDLGSLSLWAIQFLMSKLEQIDKRLKRLEKEKPCR